MGRSQSSLPAISSPFVHQLPPLLEKVASPIRSFRLVPNAVRQRRFRDLAGMVGLLADPVPEGRAKAVGGRVLLHLAKQLRERHVAHWHVPPGTGKHKRSRSDPQFAATLDDGDCWCRQRNDMLTRRLHPRGRDRPELLLQVEFSHAAPRTSPDRTAVRMAKRSARRLKDSRSASLTMKAGTFA